MSIRLLLIDNYDSFVFNALHLFQVAADVDVTVVRNNDDFLPLLAQGAFDGVIIGPGPGTPKDDAYFGHSKSVILDYGRKGLPILGICLGFQGIYHVFGGQLKKAATPIHGKVSVLQIEQPGVLLAGVSDGAAVMRYHSLMADLDQPIPDCFECTAFVQENSGQSHEQHLVFAQAVNGRELMAFEHKKYPMYGVQFHPESFATECGMEIALNFVKKCREISYT